MSMTQTQEHNVPALRFPEFSGEWENSKLSKHVASLDAGVSVNSGDSPASSVKFGILKTSAVTNGVFEAHENKVVFEDREIKRLKEPVQAETIIISRMNTPALVGANAYIEEDHKNLFLPDRLWAAKLASNSSTRFIAYILGSAKGRSNLSRRATGTSGTMKNITKPDVLGLHISAPKLPEQQKIASFLSQVDRKIAQLGEKKALLQAYKKGMMQKLFSQELRFKDPQGHDFPDWEEKRLGELGEIVTGKTPKTSDSSLWNGEIPFITPTDIDEDTKYLRVTIRNISKTEKLRILPSGSVLFTCIASIGKMCLSTEPSVTNQQINSLSVRGPNISEFVYYALKKITPKIKATQANTTLPIINKTEFSKFVIGLPSLPEQQKIADFLSSIDRKIDLLATELDHAKTFKKGLLQQMFI